MVQRPQAWRGGRWAAAVLAVAALALSACGAKPSAELAAQAASKESEQAATSAEDGPGVTAKEVKVGFVLLQTEKLQKTLGITLAPQGDLQKQIDELAAEVNRTGGIAGRKMVPVVRPFEALTDSQATEEKLCKTFTQDDQVFAVVLVGQFQSTVRSCYAQAKTLMLDTTAFPLDQESFDQYAPYLWQPSYPEYGELNRAMVKDLADSGFFKRSTLGVVGIDNDQNRRVYDEQIKPALKEAGATPEDVRWIDGSSSSTLQSGQDQAVLAFKEADVDRLLVVGGSRLASFMMATAQKQDWFPRFALSTWDSPDFGIRNYPKSMVGAQGVSVLPGFDVGDEEFAFPAVGAESDCVKVLERSGDTFPTRANARQQLLYCDAAFLLRDTFEDSDGPVNADEFQAGVELLGPDYSRRRPTTRASNRDASPATSASAARCSIRTAPACASRARPRRSGASDVTAPTVASDVHPTDTAGRPGNDGGNAATKGDEATRRRALFPYLGDAGWRPLVSLCLISACTVAPLIVLVLHRPELRLDLQLGPAGLDRAAGLAISGLLVAAFIASLCTDIANAGLLLRVGVALSAVAAITLAGVNDPGWLQVLVFATVVFAGIPLALLRAYAYDVYGPDGGWRIAGALWAAAGAGAVVVGVIEWVWSFPNWGYELALFAVVALAGAAVLPAVPTREPPARTAAGRRVRPGELAPFAVLAATAGLAIGAAAPTALDLLVDSWNMDRGTIGGVVALTGLAVVGLCGFGHWYHHLVDRPAAHLAGVAGAAMLLAGVLLAGGAASETLVGLVFCWAAAGTAAAFAAVAGDAALLPAGGARPRHYRGAVLVAAGLAGATGITLGPWMVDQVGQAWTLVAAAAPAALIGWMVMVAYPSGVSQVEPAAAPAQPLQVPAVIPLPAMVDYVVPTPNGTNGSNGANGNGANGNGSAGNGQHPPLPLPLPAPLPVGGGAPLAAELLRCQDITAGYDGVQVLFGVDLTVREGQIVALDGHQRRRQDHVAANGVRSARPDHRVGDLRRRRHHVVRPDLAGPTGHEPDRRRRVARPGSDRRREPAHVRLHAGRQAGPGPGRRRCRTRAVPPSGRATQPTRVHAVGWREADARAGQGLRAQATAPGHRRVLVGARPEDRGRTPPGGGADQRLGHLGAAGRAVGQRRVVGRPPRLLHGEGRDRLRRQRRRAARRARPVALRLPRGHLAGGDHVIGSLTGTAATFAADSAGTLETWNLTVGGFDLGGRVILLGILTGLTYGMLAIGLVLVYRSSKFINFAHIGIGLFGAAVLSLAVRDYGLPYWPAMIVGMAVSAAAAVVTETGVVRKLEGTPRVLSMVATLGMASFFFFVALALNPEGLQGLNFPKPDGLPTFNVDSLLVDTYYTAQAVVGIAILAALSLFLWRSKYGVAIRGAASNADGAALAGVRPGAMAMLSWGLAGAVACFAVAMLIPTKGAVNPESIGPDLLLRALAAAAIARFRSLWGALFAAIGIGVVESVLATSDRGNGYADVVIFAAVVISLLLTSRQGREEPEPWGHLESSSVRLPPAYRRVWLIRNMTNVAAGIVLVIAILLPFWMSNSVAATGSQVLAIALIGVSVTVISGLAGQLSLGQFAIGGVAAAVCINVTQATGVFVLGLVAAAVVGGVVSALIGIPALRVKGLFLGVITLSFALVCSSWLLRQPWMLGRNGTDTAPPSLNIVEGESRNYFWVALAALVLALLVVRSLRHGAFGRKLEAVRDNDDTARAFSVPSTRVKIQAYVIAGMLAGLGGAIYANAFDKVDVVSFPVQKSIDVVIIAVIGGIGSLAGPILGAIYLLGIPAWLGIDNSEALAAFAAIWLVLLTYEPNGLAGVGRGFTNRTRDLIARFHGIDPARAHAGEDVVDLAEAEAVRPHLQELRPARGVARPTADTPTILTIEGLTKRFGELVAVGDVSFDVRQGETLGLIGPNGAGKTTVFEMISGFVKPDEGSIKYRGKEISDLRPEYRSRIGIVRSFQSATLFPTLSLLDTVMVARERARRSNVIESSLGLQKGEKAREADAEAIIDLFGLTEFSSMAVRTLPTGTRRLVELACTVALEPRVILLDEPSAGIAQSETEELGLVLTAIREAYGVTFVVIEHDMPLLTSICDRMVAMEVGRVIATGTCAEVQSDPAVVSSYLGDNTVAVARSGSLPPEPMADLTAVAVPHHADAADIDIFDPL